MRNKRLRASAIRAAQFIYLNRTCWNGLYRVNLCGVFNVPIGTKTNVVLPSDNFQGVSKLLKRVKLANKDFETALRETPALEKAISTHDGKMLHLTRLNGSEGSSDGMD